MAEYNYQELFDLIEQTAKSETLAADGMHAVIGYCAKVFPHRDWDKLAAIKYDRDVKKMRRWLKSLLMSDPPDREITLLWFGLFNPIYKDIVTADMRVNGGQYAKDPEEWDWNPGWFPEDGGAASSALHQIYQIAYAEDSDGLGNEAEYPLCLAYGCLAIREVAQKLNKNLLGKAKDRVVFVGFDSGDMMCIGAATGKGLVLSREAEFMAAPGL